MLWIHYKLQIIQYMSFKKVRDAHRTENTEDYLEIIADLLNTKGEARIVDIANKLDIAQATANKTIQRLQNQGDSKILSVTIAHEESATEADAMATAFNVIGYPDALNIANDNNIALMLVIVSDGGSELIFSNKWYDLGL